MSRRETSTRPPVSKVASVSHDSAQVGRPAAAAMDARDSNAEIALVVVMAADDASAVPAATPQPITASVRDRDGRRPATGQRPGSGHGAAWVERWHDVIDPEPAAPGVYRRKDGGFHVRGRVKDPRTGKLREVNRAMPDVRKVRDASALLAAELTKAIGTEAGETAAMPRFKDYAATIFERRVTDGTILSAKGREKWHSTLKVHLLPAFGDFYLDKITTGDIEAWKGRVSPARSGYKPATVNSVLAILRVVLGCAAQEYEIRDPIAHVEPFDTRGHRTYTDESPNSLAPADVPRFLAKLRELFPQHYAFAVLGFTTGLRPSSLRPLRRRGGSADIKWPERMLLIRRSHTRKDEVMEATKTDRDQRLHLPRDLVSILEWHVERLPPGPMRESELLFPSEIGAYRSSSCLDRPFDKVAKEIKLAYPVSPRCMRRTFQDIAREAGVADVVTRAISGHATATMQEHYSTARDHEVSSGLAKVIDFAKVRESMVEPTPLRRQRRRVDRLRIDVNQKRITANG